MQQLVKTKSSSLTEGQLFTCVEPWKSRVQHLKLAFQVRKWPKLSEGRKDLETERRARNGKALHYLMAFLCFPRFSDVSQDRFDSVFVFEEGRVVEQGPKREQSVAFGSALFNLARGAPEELLSSEGSEANMHAICD